MRKASHLVLRNPKDIGINPNLIEISPHATSRQPYSPRQDTANKSHKSQFQHDKQLSLYQSEMKASVSSCDDESSELPDKVVAPLPRQFSQQESFKDEKIVNLKLDQQTEIQLDSEEESDDEELLDLLVISTSSLGFQVWKAVMIVTSFVSSFHYAQLAAYSEEPEGADGIYQILFGVDMLLNFITENHSHKQDKAERKFRKIAISYLRGVFLLDVITLFPFKSLAEGLLGMPSSYSSLFYLLKLVRIIVGFRLLQYQTYMIQIKSIIHQRTLRIVEQNEELAHSQEYDNTNITFILVAQFLLKVTQLIVYLLCGSYFLGMDWLILCKHTKSDEDNFIDYFDLESSQSQKITLVYFAFTSLSTVGLGDYHPRSNIERGVGAFVLLFGVALTSYIMETLSLMLIKLQSINKPFEQQSQLSQFVKTLERFNFNVGLPDKLMHSLEKYFEYRWSKNKNHPLQSEDDQHLFTQLPVDVQRRICSDFLHSEFLQTYRRYFRQLTDLNKKEYQMLRQSKIPGYGRSRTIFEFEVQEEILDFQDKILKCLEPLHFSPGHLIMKQNQKVNTAVFLLNGSAQVGYNHEFFMHKKGFTKSKVQYKAQNTYKLFSRALKSFKKQDGGIFQEAKYHYPFKVKPGQVIGLFEMMFERESDFLYRAAYDEQTEGFFVRKANWGKITKDAVLMKNFSRIILLEYLDKIYRPVTEYQKLQEEQGEVEEFGASPTLQNKQRALLRGRRKSDTSCAGGGSTHPRFSLMDVTSLINDPSNIKKAPSQSVNLSRSPPRSRQSVKNAEDSLKRQQTRLVQAILWKDRLEDEELQKLADEVLTDKPKDVKEDGKISLMRLQSTLSFRLDAFEQVLNTFVKSKEQDAEYISLLEEQNRQLQTQLADATMKAAVEKASKICGCPCVFHSIAQHSPEIDIQASLTIPMSTARSRTNEEESKSFAKEELSYDQAKWSPPFMDGPFGGPLQTKDLQLFQAVSHQEAYDENPSSQQDTVQRRASLEEAVFQQATLPQQAVLELPLQECQDEDPVEKNQEVKDGSATATAPSKKTAFKKPKLVMRMKRSSTKVMNATPVSPLELNTAEKEGLLSLRAGPSQPRRDSGSAAASFAAGSAAASAVSSERTFYKPFNVIKKKKQTAQETPSPLPGQLLGLLDSELQSPYEPASKPETRHTSQKLNLPLPLPEKPPSGRQPRYSSQGFSLAVQKIRISHKFGELIE